MSATLARIDRLALALARGLALAGGALLLGLIAMVVISVAGRASGIGPVRGDYELIELCAGLAVFAFLPWCQITGGHARVDVLTHRLPPAARRGLDLLWDVVMAVAMAVIAWRLGAGTASKLASGETSFLIGLPIGWAYAAALVAAVAAAAVAAWIALAGALRLVTGAAA